MTVLYKAVGKYSKVMEQVTDLIIQQLAEFDITSAAGGQETVYVRFRWSGTWGYSWEIDDIQVYATPENDVRIDNYIILH